MVLAQVGYAFLYFITETSFNHGMSPFLYVTYRHIVAAVIMFPFAFFLERFNEACNMMGVDPFRWKKNWMLSTLSSLSPWFSCSRTSSLPLSAPVSLLSQVSHSSSSSLFVSSLITISHQSRSRAFPALVVVNSRSSRSRDWSSSSLPISSPSHTQSRAFVAIVVLVAAPAEAAGPGADFRCCLLASTFAISFLRTTRSWSPICTKATEHRSAFNKYNIKACAFESNEKICQQNLPAKVKVAKAPKRLKIPHVHCCNKGKQL
ncbi:uncharacterized protein [Arachis hypogaea]|uniref:uncharacterized protein n=1 Tax=Arachis hypogaea TaxID=3818 RepID=UPI003B212C55